MCIEAENQPRDARYIAPLPPDYCDIVAERYDSLYSEPEYVAEDEDLRAQVLNRHHFPEPVLDLGAGTGLLSRLMPTTNVISLDLSRAMLRRFHGGNEAQGGRRVEGCAQHLPFRSGSIGSVVSLYGSMGYQDIDLADLREEIRLVTDGPVMLMLPSLDHRGNRCLIQAGLDDPIRRYDRRELRELGWVTAWRAEWWLLWL